MATSRDSGKNQNSKRIIPPQPKSKRVATKVVDVKLKASASKAAAKKNSAKRAAVAKSIVRHAAKAMAKPVAKTLGKSVIGATKKASPQKTLSQKVTKSSIPAAKVLAKKGITGKDGAGRASLSQSMTKSVEKASETPVHLTTPTPAMLKTFRKAVDRSRKLAKQAATTRTKGALFMAKPLKNAKRYTVDLRIHSPGTVGYFSTGGVDPGPALVRLAKVKGLDMIAVTDYYNATFVDPLQVLARESGITVLPGVDLCCSIGDCNEVYVTALFPDTVTGTEIFTMLRELGVYPENYGRRDFCLNIPFEQVLQAVESRGGIVIPSRVDKTPYRQLALSALIEKYGFHAFDLVHPENTDFFRDRWPDGQFTFFSFSNANALAQIGSRVAKIKMQNPGFAGLKELVQRRS